MRNEFANELYRLMIDPKIFMLCGDVGYGVMDKIISDYPERAFNVGASEQAMVDMGVGLALAGMIPVIYTITPFLLYRPFESIRLYMGMENIPVKLISSGRDKDYFYIGITHFSEDDRKLMGLYPKIKSYWPNKAKEIPKLLESVIYNNKPSYINLSR